MVIVFGDWHAFAFGHSYPIPYGAQFLATAGGVIQFRPPGETPVWYGTLLSRLNTVVAWAREAELPSHSSDRPVCVLHHDSTTVTLFSGSRFPGAGARETIADLVGRQPTTALLFVTPTGSGCARLCVHGVDCRAVLAVYPLTPTPDRLGKLIFLDPRQANLPLAHWYSEDGRLMPQDLIRYLGLRPPPLYHVSFMPGPRADGCIACREGDTVLIGFRADADSSDEAPDQTESVNDSSGQDEPGESEPDLADDDPQSPVEHEPDAVEPRQRNRSRTPPLSAVVDQELPGFCAAMLHTRPWPPWQQRPGRVLFTPKCAGWMTSLHPGDQTQQDELGWIELWPVLLVSGLGNRVSSPHSFRFPGQRSPQLWACKLVSCASGSCFSPLSIRLRLLRWTSRLDVVRQVLCKRSRPVAAIGAEKCFLQFSPPTRSRLLATPLVLHCQHGARTGTS